MVYFWRTHQITLSTWIRTFAIERVSSTSRVDSWSFPLVKAGILSLACCIATEFEISKPRSARTISPGSNLSKIPQCSVKYLSLTLPPQASEIYETTPWGVIPISSLIVITLWCLYKDHVHARASRFDGRSMNTSKQSITTATFSPNAALKHSGIVSLRASLSGHRINGLIVCPSL